MFLPFLAAIVAAPSILNVTNRFLEEYIIPLRAIKKKEDIYPLGFDLAITGSELKSLKDIGALQILQQGVNRHQHLMGAGVAAVCAHCSRLRG